MDDKNYLVYVHINKTPENNINKKYIGITCQSVNERWANGNGYKKQDFYNAIQKYGWGNFEHKVLIHGLSREQACRWEIKLIAHFKTFDKKYGYNLSLGGDCQRHTEESRIKISKNNSRYYLGKKLLQKTKDKLREQAFKKPVVCLETGIIYESAHEASRTTGARVGHIVTICKERTPRKMAGGYHWKYLYEKDKGTPDYVTVKKQKVKCIETGEIYESIMDAARKHGLHRTVISHCINTDNKILTAGGYHWEKYN